MAHRLSDFASLGLEVLRDAEFERTGRLSTRLAGLCVPLRSQAYVQAVNENPDVTAVIATRELAEEVDPRLGLAVAAAPDAAHAEIHARLAERIAYQPNRIDPSAVIHPRAVVADHGVEIGAGSRIAAGAVIEAGVLIGRDCVIHAGVVLGAEGFNTAIVGGRRRIMPHVGRVRLADRVELLPQVSVARALFGGDTVIGEETLVDMHAYIAHDAQIGRRVQICALANILGRVEIGEDAYIGPSAVVRNGLKIGAGAKVSLGAVVTRDVAAGEQVSGNFAIPHETFLQKLRS